MNLRNLFAAAMVCATLALSHGVQAEGPGTNTLLHSQEVALAASVDVKEPAQITVAQVQQLKKRVLTDPPRPEGPQSFQAKPGGPQAFEACCTACPAGGCTGCNSGPAGLSCGTGLIKATCQVVNDVSTCVKEEKD